MLIQTWFDSTLHLFVYIWWFELVSISKYLFVLYFKSSSKTSLYDLSLLVIYHLGPCQQWRSHLCVRGCTCIPWFFKFPPNNMGCLYICTSWNCIHAPPKTLTSNFVDTLYFLGLKHWWCCYRWQTYLVAFTCWLCYFYLIFVM